ncbi:hypothetical protein JRQ81_005981 [Phrynocephalus forsythii]|uniref:Uncharacterized protein n=1 Tax=Phrynocephalus forsythii TaxID=171643 RepID=A0A9Q1B612_9SAUR|nr:hypothetical protein JRQ81_005981 [Phrynocephalus forsythii]
MQVLEQMEAAQGAPAGPSAAPAAAKRPRPAPQRPDEEGAVVTELADEDQPLMPAAESAAPNDLAVCMRKSKTDQKGKGAEISLGPCSAGEICPVVAMRGYLKLKGPREGYLFIHQDGRPLTKFQFSAVTSRVLGPEGRAYRARIIFVGHSYVYWAEKFGGPIYSKDDELFQE